MVRDTTSSIVKAWVSRVFVDGVFAAEATAAEMALRIAGSCHSDNIMI